MNDLEKTDRESSYRKYEKLLLERDALRKEAGSCLTAYIRQFGELINKVFEIKIDCISKKKSIAFCQAAVNRGEMVNASELRSYIESTMKDYHDRLAKMIEEYKSVQAAKASSEYDCITSKIIYRRIAKLIHPDINPKVWEYPETEDLWNRTVLAYELNDADELTSIEILVHMVLDEYGIDADEIIVDNIEERIEQIQAEIRQITSTDPYLYKELLEDAQAVADKKMELEREYEAYARYADELQQTLRQLLMRGVIVEWQEN